jgi:hypothetical protein
LILLPAYTTAVLAFKSRVISFMLIKDMCNPLSTMFLLSWWNPVLETETLKDFYLANSKALETSFSLLAQTIKAG